ncbi:hypothetical protein VB713_20235 [Anabaena cylindrica UHCC 0172]|uniref:hypothetical protein n=1 Tax=Anabaena cylindrica TaxID=1165 RepID=UPI002B1F8167|nr:hypothetical protein [Anabaena cylindrica]MEA5553272.1 hypothetical protein [Anabaena cylindrica UHCC 0172]
MNLLTKFKHFRKINYLGLLMISACTPASSQGQLFTYREGNFSIFMPGAIPEETTTAIQGITVRTWTTVKNESLYTVAHSKFANKIAPDKRQQVLQALINAATKTNFSKGKKLSQTAVNKDGYNCQDFSLTGEPSVSVQGEAKKTGLNIKSKLYYQRNMLCIKDDQVVEAVVFTPSDEELKNNGASFIKSLNLKP